MADIRGPKAVAPAVLETGARAVTVEEDVKDKDAVVLAIPFGVAEQLAGLFASVPLRDGGRPHLHARIALDE
ncbi:hypothetical protein ABZ192_03735 [Streptomyces sp. NPDC006235]|uniref:hypothetical protein n=1 Tax=Streptomyces sp. NPDC006235 TaxID=3156736 RepID=UPI0033A2E656